MFGRLHDKVAIVTGGGPVDVYSEDNLETVKELAS